MNHAKIQLSEDELCMALNGELILTKNRIIHKVYQLFGSLAESYRQYSGNTFSFLPVIQHPKIARGENYKELPYVMLDYPRYFTHTDIFAVRTMFWWGNDLSITLHLRGEYKELFGRRVVEVLSNSEEENWYVQTMGDEWQHHYSADTHKHFDLADNGILQNMVETSSFTKLSSFLSLKRWNEAEEVLSEKFTEIVTAITDQLPNR